jgi:Spy/CpxP family protein refolding chaperone
MFMSHRAWRHAYAAACWQQAHSQSDAQPRHRAHSMFSWSSGPTFGVRRPLRHLAWKLNLSEAQIRDVVDVLDRLKTAYNQARLDQDRSTSEVAAVFAAAEFDADRVTAALANRTRATEVLNLDLLAATRRIFELLNEEQRREFAYLLRSGAFVL